MLSFKHFEYYFYNYIDKNMTLKESKCLTSNVSFNVETLKNYSFCEIGVKIQSTQQICGNYTLLLVLSMVVFCRLSKIDSLLFAFLHVKIPCRVCLLRG